MIALLVVGPDKLPGLARTVGVWVGKAQRLVGQVRADIEREVRADELRKAAKEYSPTNLLSDVKKEVEDFAGDVSKPLDLDEEATAPAKSGPDDAGEVEAGKEKAGEEKAEAGKAKEGRSEVGAGASAATGSTVSAPDSAELSAEDEPGTESTTAAPGPASGAGNGADAAAPERPEPVPAGPETADPQVADTADVAVPIPPEPDPNTPPGKPPAGSGWVAPKVGAELPNGQPEGSVPPPMTESVESSLDERDERTAAP